VALLVHAERVPGADRDLTVVPVSPLRGVNSRRTAAG
jgi:hypothetical protein